MPETKNALITGTSSTGVWKVVE